MNIVFFNVGWMEKYRGEDEILGGGKGPQKQGWGHEVINFETFEGNVYGYVQIPYKGSNVGQLHIEKINADYKNKDEISDVLVVWVARQPIDGGRRIVGWYKNATVYRNYKDDVKERTYKNELIQYNVKANKEDVFCIPVSERVFSVPSRKEAFGQAQIWYAENQPLYKQRVFNYINSYNSSQTVGVRKYFQHDQEKKEQTEKRAVEEVTNHYQSQGFTVISKEKENVGWDLEVTKAEERYFVEVKGTSTSTINVQFSPNEFKKMQEKKLNGYKIAIVTNALENPSVRTFAYVESGTESSWYDEVDGLIELELIEVISAVAKTA